MSDVKLFRLANGSAVELIGNPVKLEKNLQVLIEKHLEALLHVRFVASECSTGKTHSGRIDIPVVQIEPKTLGITPPPGDGADRRVQ